MSAESLPTPEKISKEQVIAAYRKFVESGIKSPDDLDLEDPAVKEAHELYDKWRAQEDAAAEGNEEAERRANFEQTKLYVDAGFTDPEYLRDVLGWFSDDAGDVEKQPDDPARSQLRQDMADEMKKIRSMLKE